MAVCVQSLKLERPQYRNDPALLQDSFFASWAGSATVNDPQAIVSVHSQTQKAAVKPGGASALCSSLYSAPGMVNDCLAESVGPRVESCLICGIRMARAQGRVGKCMRNACARTGEHARVPAHPLQHAFHTPLPTLNGFVPSVLLLRRSTSICSRHEPHPVVLGIRWRLG